MRAPTPDEVADVRHEASSVTVRARGRCVLLRVAHPADVDPNQLVDAVRDVLATTPLREVQIATVVAEGPARVVGGVFE
jgi:hypothetical protein